MVSHRSSYDKGLLTDINKHGTKIMASGRKPVGQKGGSSWTMTFPLVRALTEGVVIIALDGQILKVFL